MIESERVAAIVAELAEAERTREPIERLTKRFPEMTVEDAYTVQGEWRRAHEEAGRRLVGRKIGLTSRAMQMATGITEPDYGIIFRDMVRDNAEIYEWDKFVFPRVEVELAFTLEKDLEGPDLTLLDAIDAIGWMTPSLEILDSRVELEGRTIVDTISDNAAMHSMVIGGRPVRLQDADPRWVGAALYVNQGIEETGLGAGVLNHPAAGVQWLANKIAAHGDKLHAGEIILAGSFTRPVPAKKGDSFVADFGPLGTVTCRFV
ncbi:MAG TPA: 2-oxo-hepta-3-ene-1,7-dioic acid hydratase [Tessaracoccus flavescens]|uniref:2-oxo-hepta-3-ene-1,7-dioic acid hydratase n=1 Tax=Tessaracoccus flavescens TaxID=399497 RepID=A0A921EMP4_9ACTN|nr:2-oxo-hepta-3-ene-1,7-dioic acid hydratase [Tessaracoccus flavescens]